MPNLLFLSSSIFALSPSSLLSGPAGAFGAAIGAAGAALWVVVFFAAASLTSLLKISLLLSAISKSPS